MLPLSSSTVEQKPASTPGISIHLPTKNKRSYFNSGDKFFWSQGIMSSESKTSAVNFFSNEVQGIRNRESALPADSSTSNHSFASNRNSFNYPTKIEVNSALQNLAFFSPQSTEATKYVLSVLEEESAKYEYPLVSPANVASILASAEDLCACRLSPLDSASTGLLQDSSIEETETCNFWSHHHTEKHQSRKRKNSWASDPWSHDPSVQPENCIINELDAVRKESMTAGQASERQETSSGLKENHRLIIIDTRYYFEYIGGHISSSLNISSPLVMRKLFLELRTYLSNEDFVKALLDLEGKEIQSSDLDDLVSEIETAKQSSESYINDSIQVFEPGSGSLHSERHNTSGTGRTKRQVIPVIVFHCEFSSQRGPKMWQFVRKLDRSLNMEVYPKLDFPQIFVLKGGYELFVKDHGRLCTPIGSYRTMLCKEFRDTLNREESKKSQEWIQLKTIK
jgi:hypothetical protein